MSRLDYVTIGIVVVCIAALAFLLYKTTNLFGGGDAEDAPLTDNTYADTTAIDPYAYDDYSDTTAILPATDEDPDDNQVNTYEEDAPSSSSTTPATSTRRESTTAPQTNEETTSGASGREGDYLVLAGSYRIKENAATEASRLRKLGYENAEVSPFNRGTFAVVLVDRFVNVSDARALANELRGKGIEAYVQEKRDE